MIDPPFEPVSFFDFDSISSYFHKTNNKIMDVGVHIVVSGLVQGVGFRYFVYNRAARLRLTGFVRNLYDGRVEIEAEGERSLIEEFIDEVKVGPRAAQITDMRVTWKEAAHQYSHFDIQ